MINHIYQYSILIILQIESGNARPKKENWKVCHPPWRNIGEGAFSKVYRGIAEDTKEQVAVKVVDKAKICEDQYTQNAFYSQIQINKKLKSPNIIKFFDVHETVHNYYIILQLAQEGTLRSTLKNTGRLDEKTTMKYLIQILNGFGELAKNGISHRDLKPQNILMKGDCLKIADFGFAKQAEINSFLRTLVGTPAYMAPQILCQQKYTYKCDIWSLGVMVYQMIVGRIPWTFAQRRDINDFRQEIMTRKIVFPHDLVISQDMKDFILGCMCIDQNKRYDWDQVFLHHLFGTKFAANNLSKTESTKISFIMANFRMNLHTKNINLNKIFQTRGDSLTKADFINLIKFINKEIPEAQIILLYDCLANKDTKVYIKDFSKFLTHFQCRLTGMDLQNTEMESQNSSMRQSRKSHPILNRLKRGIQKQSFDIGKMFRPKSQNRQNYMDFAQFSKLIHLIDEAMNQKQIQVIFNEFDTNHDHRLTNDQFYKGVCKIAQIVPMQEQD